MLNYEWMSTTEKVVRCVQTVCGNLGPGMLDSIYERALCSELDKKNIRYERKSFLPYVHKNKNIGKYYMDVINTIGYKEEFIIENGMILRVRTEKDKVVFESQLCFQSVLKTNFTISLMSPLELI